MDSSTDQARKGPCGAGRVELRLEEHDGERALFVPRWSAPARVGAAIMVVLVLAATVAALVALFRGSPTLGVALLVLAAILAGLLLRNLLRNPFNGGVWLTPTSLSTRWGRAGWTMPWEDVAVVAYTGSRQDIGVRSRSDGSEHVISSHLLVMAPCAVMTLADVYSQDSSRRHELGTEPCLDEARAVRAAYGGSSFRPVIHGSPTASRSAMFAGAVVLAGLVLALAALGRASLGGRRRARLQRPQPAVLPGTPGLLGDVRRCGRQVGAGDTGLRGNGRRPRDLRVQVTLVNGDRVGYKATER